MPTYSSLHVHVVFSTRSRDPWVVDPTRLHAYLAGVLQTLGAFPIEIGGTADHVHILFGHRPAHSVSDIVREMKKASSAAAKGWWGNISGWQEGFAAFSVGRAEIESVRAYVRNQEEHHRQKSSVDEYLDLCTEFGIEVDRRYLE